MTEECFPQNSQFTKVANRNANGATYIFSDGLRACMVSIYLSVYFFATIAIKLFGNRDAIGRVEELLALQLLRNRCYTLSNNYITVCRRFPIPFQYWITLTISDPPPSAWCSASGIHCWVIVCLWSTLRGPGGGVNLMDRKWWPSFLIIVKPVDITIVHKKTCGNETVLLNSVMVSITDPAPPPPQWR